MGDRVASMPVQERAAPTGSTGQAARACAGLAAAAGLLFGLAFLVQLGATPPLATDFLPYWSAARLTLAGHLAQAYDNAAIEAFERAHAHLGAPGYLAFYYPPPFLLLCLPLGLLGYVAALLVFLAAEAACLLPVLWRLAAPATPAARRLAALLLLGLPGFWMNAASGQNAGFSAAGYGAAALWLDRRPLLAGACLGALGACKPQLALPVPVALLGARRWRALAAAAASAIALAALSLLALGDTAWRGFLANAPAARADLETLAIKWRLMQSTYALLRQWGASLSAAYLGQALVAASALALLARGAARRPGAAPEAAATAAAALLATPFLYDYDLLIAAVPLAVLAARPLGPAARLLLVALYLAPWGARALGILAGTQIAPPLLLGLLLLLTARPPRAPRPA